MSDVSTILKSMYGSKEIYYYYKFREDVSKRPVIADHLVIKNDRQTTIFIEEKMTTKKDNKLYWGNVIGNQGQIQTNRELSSGHIKHIYLFGYLPNNAPHFYAVVPHLYEFELVKKSYASPEHFYQQAFSVVIYKGESLKDALYAVIK